MKYSIRTKTIILILVAIGTIALLLSGISILSIEKLTDEYAHQNVTLICEKNASEINGIFKTLEHSVDYMSLNALEEVSNPSNLKDSVYYKVYMEKMRSLLWNTGNNTDWAISVYLRLDPAICGPTAGLFMTREQLGNEMSFFPPTDISEFDKNDTERVGWYYQPLEAGEAVWMSPYYNKNIGVYMISYVFPLYKNSSTLGILGMDINFDQVTEKISDIKVYKSGYAYITDPDGKVIYHPNLEYGESIPVNKEWWVSSCELDNGMVLNITAPEKEIKKSRNRLINNLAISTILITVLFVAAAIYYTNKMIAPLGKLNRIANEISGGNYEVDFNFERPSDEIGQLTKSFEHTVVKLKEYTSYINGLAYKDALTGVRNRMAYDEQVALLEDGLRKGEELSFAVIVFDINNLKQINDNLGHEKGDVLITGGCKLICDVFNDCAIFRVGGDEFVAIAQRSTEERLEKKFEEFDAKMQETWGNEEPELRISVAHGCSFYNPSEDNEKVEAVFERADKIMYDNKKAMKEKQAVAFQA